MRLRNTRCPAPAPAPFKPYANCPQRFVRSCSDGTGVVVASIPGAYLFAATPELANAYALKIAKYKALKETMYCNTLTPDDLLGCGDVQGRPDNNPTCGVTYCDQLGNAYCNELGTNYTPN